MVSRKRKNSKSKRKPRGRPVKVVAVPRKSRMNGPSRSSLDPHGRDWLLLLADPCRGRLVSPPYAGANSGYLVRTNDLVTLTGGTGGAGYSTGQIVLVDGYIGVSPWNFSSTTGIFASFTGSGLSVNPGGGPFGINDFITSAVVKRYRPVAACAKWIPSGPYATRAGVVGMCYSPGVLVRTGTPAFTINAFLGACPVVDPNGSVLHETNWLPTVYDQNFGAATESNNNDVGSFNFAFKGVDATATGATTFSLNGYMEVTVVWEWVPDTTLTGGDLCIMPTRVSRSTVQDVLSRIGDMGAFLYKMSSHMPNGAARLLTAGVMTGFRRGQALIQN